MLARLGGTSWGCSAVWRGPASRCGHCRLLDARWHWQGLPLGVLMLWAVLGGPWGRRCGGEDLPRPGVPPAWGQPQGCGGFQCPLAPRVSWPSGCAVHSGSFWAESLTDSQLGGSLGLARPPQHRGLAGTLPENQDLRPPEGQHVPWAGLPSRTVRCMVGPRLGSGRSTRGPVAPVRA